MEFPGQFIQILPKPLQAIEGGATCASTSRNPRAMEERNHLLEPQTGQ